ncbi:MAG: hypothetical protein EXR74_10050 [Bdellovibrionales bacterium]|nr:hypothetical protein [Bdellovibrionales bacterium]
MKLTKENFSVKALASSATEGVLRLYPDCVVTTIFDLESESHVGADREKVARVISNLTENAIQAMGERGTLRLAVKDVIEDGKPAVEISIGNDGPVTTRSTQIDAVWTPDFSHKVSAESQPIGF